MIQADLASGVGKLDVLSEPMELKDRNKNKKRSVSQYLELKERLGNHITLNHITLTIQP